MTGLTTGWIVPGCFALVSAIIGGWLLRRGLRGRRVGDEPHCRICGYNLTGATAARCSECGAELVGNAVVIGIRHRRPASITVGSILLLVALTVGTVSARRVYTSVNWYQYYPLSWILRDLRTDQRGAVGELNRRLGSGELSLPERDRVVNALIDKHCQPPPNRPGLWLSSVLWRLVLDDVLTDAQLKRYFSGLFTLELCLPQEVRAGSWVSLEISAQASVGIVLHSDTLVYTHQVDRVSFDGEVIAVNGIEEFFVNALGGLPDGDSRRITILVPESAAPGATLVTYQARQSVFKQPFQPGGREALWMEPVILRATTEVLPADAPIPVEWIDDPTLEEELIRAFKDVFVARRSDAEHIVVSPEWHKSARPLPAPVAFEVILRIDDEEYAAGMWAFDADGEVCANFSPRLRIPDSNPPELILRASKDVAHKWCGFSKTWRGELNLGTLCIPPAKEN